MKLTEKDNGKTIVVNKGDIVDIDLEWNPSTGYCWLENDNTAGEVEEVKHESITEDPDIIGSPAIAHYKMRINNEGNLRLALSRPWEGLKPPIKIFEIKVKT